MTRARDTPAASGDDGPGGVGAAPPQAQSTFCVLVCARCRRPLRMPTSSPSPPHLRGRVLTAIRNWPEGRICSGCYAKACETYGVCDGCRVHRLLPGLGPDAQRWCTDCAGLGNFTCTRCGQEGWNHYLGVCGRCVLRERLTVALDDGTGSIRSEMQALFDLLVSMTRPRVGILWLAKPHVPPLLHAIAAGQVPLTHEGIATLAPWRCAIHVRDLLVTAGTLPPVDRELFLFQQWLPGWLEQIPDEDHRRVLTRYATWHELRAMRLTADHVPVGHYRSQNARQRLRTALVFIQDLEGRDTTLAECGQAQLDQWIAQTKPAQRKAIRAFLAWAIRARITPALRLPPTIEAAPSPISGQHRIRLIRRLLDGNDMDLTERVVGLLILLYAQPLNRIVRLSIDDITTAAPDHTQTTDTGKDDAGTGSPEAAAAFMCIRLGEPPAPVPAPFDDVIRSYLSARPNMTTATNRDSRWLFPGRRGGQPLHPTSIRLRLQRLGIPNLNGRSRALRELLLQAPPSVVATMLGYSTGRSQAIAAQAGGTWKHYAPGDHSPMTVGHANPTSRR